MSETISGCYICGFCDLKFKDQTDLDLHNKLHVDNGQFSCPSCKEIFPDLQQLELHDLQHSLEEVNKDESSAYITFLRPASSFICKICNKVFLSDEELFEHVIQHEEAIVPLPKGSETLEEIKLEIDQEAQLFLFEEPATPTKKAKTKRSAKKKRSKYKVPNEYKCNICKKVFNAVSYLTRHENIYHRNKKLFNGPASLRRHENLFHMNKRSGVDIEVDLDPSLYDEIYPVSSDEETPDPNSYAETDNVNEYHDKPFCYACFKVFPTEDDVNEHMDEHIMIRTFDCEVCKKRFKNQVLLEKHKCVSDGPRPFLCKICGRRFLRIYHLERHLAVHKRKKELFGGVRNDSKDSSDEKPYECDKCEKRYKTEIDLSKHRCDNDGPRTFVCKECGKRFNRIYHLQRHEELHNRTEPLYEPIEFDLSYFKRQKSVDLSNTEYPVLKPIKKVKTEINEVNVMKRFDCYICGKRWSGFQKYKQHFSTVHKDVKFNSCHICSKQFSKSSKVKRHLVTHYKEKTFRCSNCSKTFFTVSALNHHIQEQECESRLTCYQCSKTFTDKTGFQEHIAMHENSKDADFECTVLSDIFVPLKKRLVVELSQEQTLSWQRA
ncbi:zinc finger protein 26-like [Argiope bruennichi]|uniref:zinc finger protein 26-like n=1 Tax=Argiope bruennichi TaxID=94029 RepID=UPI002493F9B8|nr:zinc finger protein 26-like [Argiope bruennichi]